MNADAFAGLYERYSDRLRHAMTARTGDPDRAEDATASAFAAAWENMDRFRGESSFYTYLYRIGANNAIQNRRRHWRTVSLDALETPLKEPAESDRVNGDAQDRANDALKLRKALNTIPEIYRRVLIDHLVFELSVKQIARRNRIPVGTVLSRIFTAKKLLRRAWES
jgi:RNA polymerase sigma-70 factor (ECF subfamily)